MGVVREDVLRQWNLRKRAIRDTRLSGAEHRVCEGPEVGVGLACSRNSQET